MFPNLSNLIDLGILKIFIPNMLKYLSEYSTDKNIKAAIKLQFRNLDTFIHKSYQKSNLKFVKRFNETRLTQEEFSSLVKYIKKNNILTCATPFDNESIKLIDKFDIDILKIASCSCDDWPLIKDVAKYIERKIIITGEDV